MSDMRIQYQEEMVGAGHPTKPDTLNRLALVETDLDGHGRLRFLKVQTEIPATGASEGVIYTRLAGGRPELFFRGADSAPEVRLTSSAGPGHLLLPRSLPGLLPDDQTPAENDAALGAVRFPPGAVAWGHFAAWLDGVAWRIRLEAMMSTAQAASVGLVLVYQVFGPDAAMSPVKARWQAGRAYALGDKVIPAAPNGSYYQCATAGTSGAAAPAWPASGAVSDGTVVWTRQGNGMTALGEYNLTPPAAAHDRFDIDGASLQIPAGAVAAGDRVHFGLWRSGGDTHAGDLIVNELWVAPVEV